MGLVDLEMVLSAAPSDKNVVCVLSCDKKSYLNVSDVTKVTIFEAKNNFQDLARNLQ